MDYTEEKSRELCESTLFREKTLSRSRKQLVGALIGLVRATEGNEQDVTEETDRLLLSGLRASARPTGKEIAGSTEDASVHPEQEMTEADLTVLMERAEAEKKRLVPRCYSCAASCGRNNNYDMERFWEDSGAKTERAVDENRLLRRQILSGLQGLAIGLEEAEAGDWTEDLRGLFYRGLYAVGREDWEGDYLQEILAEIERIQELC